MKKRGRRFWSFALSAAVCVIPAGAASELPSRLPVMGMIWWVPPALFVGGILLAIIGWKRHTGEEEKKDGADQP